MWSKRLRNGAYPHDSCFLNARDQLYCVLECTADSDCDTAHGRLRGSVATQHSRFAVSTQARLGSRGKTVLPRRSVDGDATRSARHGPERLP
jgi:hypothetical protein